jgi:hypothetical protein
MIDTLEQIVETIQPLSPELYEREQVAVTGRRQRCGSLIARLDALLKKSLHFGDKVGAGELVRENRGKADGDGRRDRVDGQSPQDLQQGKIGVEGCFTDPVASMRPAPMVQDIWEVTVEREDEIRGPRAHRAPGE